MGLMGRCEAQIVPTWAIHVAANKLSNGRIESTPARAP